MNADVCGDRFASDYVRHHALPFEPSVPEICQIARQLADPVRAFRLWPKLALAKFSSPAEARSAVSDLEDLPSQPRGWDRVVGGFVAPQAAISFWESPLYLQFHPSLSA